MTMNKYERAVIEAARSVVHYDLDLTARESAIGDLAIALRALDSQAAAGTADIEWTLVAAGDEIRGKSGAFFPVLGTRAEVALIDGRARPTGQVKVRIGLPGGPRTITRPHPDEPFATVKRGPDGQAVDEFVNVFSSGDRA